MSLRICVFDDKNSSKARKSPSNHSSYLNPSRTSPPKTFYIKQANHVSRRSKSPFQKYEQCVKRTTPSPSQTRAINHLVVRKTATVDSKTLNSKTNYKTVNRFEDLVFAAVNTPPTSNENNLVCYKNKYLLNLSDSCWNLAAIISDTFHHRDEPKVIDQIVNIPVVRLPSKTTEILEQKPKEIELKIHEEILCSKCKCKIGEEEKEVKNGTNQQLEQKKCVRFGDECSSTVKRTTKPTSEVITRQPPLGTPENTQLINNNKKATNLNLDDDSLIDIELDPETAEQFINLLIAEDAMLRRKLAEGDVDPRTLKRLERLNELRQKYIQYKNDLERSKLNQKIETKIPKAPELPKLEKSTIEIQINNDSNKKSDFISERRSSDSSSGENFKKSELFIKKNKQFQLKTSPLTRIKSLSDPAFSMELKQHPLVRE